MKKVPELDNEIFHSHTLAPSLDEHKKKHNTHVHKSESKHFNYYKLLLILTKLAKKSAEIQGM